MTARTVDVVIVGTNAAALAATADAAGRGLRVVLVIRPQLSSLSREFRQCLRQIESRRRRQVSTVTGGEVVCVDGVSGVEAVVVRHVRTGRLIGFNASALLDFEGSHHA